MPNTLASAQSEAPQNDSNRDEFPAALHELARLLERAVKPVMPSSLAPGDVLGAFDATRRVGAMSAFRAPQAGAPNPVIYTPMLCVLAQGRKRIALGDEFFDYEAGHFLLNSTTLPAAQQILEANPARPCLWLTVELDPALVGEVITESGHPQAATAPLRAVKAQPIERPLLDAVLRLARGFEAPAEVDFLAPLLMREIVFRLLQSEPAPLLHQLAARGDGASRVMSAIEWLRQNFKEPLTIESLAAHSGLSQSALHEHFKAVTAMTPLQFQKQMRLQEAKRLMFGQGLNVAQTAMRVGYDDPSYFTRDYRRFFGAPPRQHIARLHRQFQLAP